MDDPRRISVYDLTSLRLHPDGLRVHQREKSLGGSGYRRTVQDSQRRWIANDAGGSYEPPQWRPRRLSSPSEDREAELEEVDEEEEEEEAEEKGASGNHKRKRKRKNARPIKRKKFLKDDSYLSMPPRNGSLEMPSQDLLKNIHLLAAKYYDERGLLLNASKADRQVKKMRKLGLLSKSISPGARSTQEALEEEERSETASDDQQVVVENSGLQKKATRDMYRVLDGSVLLALGVLTQELVKKLIAGKRPRKITRAPLPDDVDVENEGENSVEDDEDPDDVEEDIKLSSFRNGGGSKASGENEQDSESEYCESEDGES